jgi:integration host factor subunit beta
LTRREAAAVLSVVLDGVVEAIREGEKVELRGFGSFRTRKRQARSGRNPRTGAQVNVPPKVVPYFKPGKQLRETLGGK